MTRVLVYAIASALLLCIGLAGLLVHRDMLRRLLALNTMTSAVFLLLVTVARQDEGPFPDPIPHAMVLTGIVVAVSATAFAIALVRRVHQETGTTELAGDDEAEG